MAVIESGTLGRLPSIDRCSAHPALYERFGLGSPYKVTVEGEEVELPVVKPLRLSGNNELRIYRHPELFIGDTIHLWKLDYSTKAKYGTRMELEDFHPCYLEAETIYEKWMKSG